MRQRRIALALLALTAWSLAAAPMAAELSGSGPRIFVEDDIGFYGPSNGDSFGWSFATGDFDGDGADDLATGIPNDDNAAGGYPRAGIVVIRYGVPGQGLSTAVSWDVVSQFNGGSPDPVGHDEGFGYALASGDFDGDGFDDLAVGAPRDGATFGGGVTLYYGSSGGLDLSGSQHFDQDSPGVANQAESFDQFAGSLAAGDFDGDGHDDLAIGAPREGTVTAAGAIDAHGAVQTLYGSPVGLSASRSQYFDQDVTGMDDATDEDDELGRALAAGDFNGDGRDDLAIGVPGENSRGGAVHVLLGGANGLTVTGNAVWSQDSAGVADDTESLDQFGTALAAGDFDRDGKDDLAIGVPFEDVSSRQDLGAVHVLRGAPGGLTATGSTFWVEGSGGLPAATPGYPYFGWSLATGDFARDGGPDLAVGARGQAEGMGEVPEQGAVIVIPASATGGLSGAGSTLWRQGVGGLPGLGEVGDHFGTALATGDFDGNGFADLIVGAPDEDIGGFFGNGAEWVIYGTWPGLPFADGFETGDTSRWPASSTCVGICF